MGYSPRGRKKSEMTEQRDKVRTHQDTQIAQKLDNNDNSNKTVTPRAHTEHSLCPRHYSRSLGLIDPLTSTDLGLVEEVIEVK